MRSNLSIGTVFALAFGCLGVGFGGVTYLVSYGGAIKELKRKRGELLGAQAEAKGRQLELEQLQKDLEAQGTSGEEIARDRSELAVISAKVQERTRALGHGTVNVKLGGRGLHVTFSEDAVFDGRGPVLARDSEGLLRSVADAIGKSAGRVLVTAPMGDGDLAAWVTANFPTPEDLSSARVRNVVRVLQKAGVPAGVVWGVSTGGPVGNGPATLQLEIEAR